MKRSEVVLALANIASKGKYEVTAAGAKVMDEAFRAVAEVINSLEEEEAAFEEAPFEAKESSSE